MKIRSKHTTCGNPQFAINALSLILAICVAVISVESVAGDYLYRYKDIKGTVVIDQSIPPDKVSLGYTILNQNGTVYKVIPAAMTIEERAQRDLVEAENADIRAEEKRRTTNDEQLLRSFSRAEDAERARERKIAALDVIIDITNGNMIRLRSKYENDESRAAALERTGIAVPPTVLENLSSLNRQIEESEQFVKEKEIEKIEVHKVFDQYVVRLRELTGH
ncbi:MAG: hypothetical protein KUG82_17910 [Pseudomonadales bacterium]|nr:hypothetical protein [Pseudomonadales bacterium]